MNSKIEKHLLSVKTCHYKHRGKSEEHYGSHQKEEKVRPECSICTLHVLNSLFPDLFVLDSLFPDLFVKRIVEIKKKYIKKSRLKQFLFAIVKQRSRYKVLNFEVDFLKTEVFQI